MADQSAIRARVKADLARHKMTIIHEKGVHRTLRFARPGSSSLHFFIATWPGHLAISGDVEDYIFSRLPDMFDFFRGHPSRDIDYRYWAEKCVAAPSRSPGGCMSFDEELWDEAIRSEMSAHLSRFDWHDKRQIVFEAKHGWKQILETTPNDAREAVELAMSWECPVSGETPFGEFWEHRLESPSHWFRWTCHAIRWAIRRYDQYHARTTQGDHDERVLGRKVAAK